MKAQPDRRPSVAPASPLLTTADVAALLRVHPKHVYRLFRRGLPRHRVGGEWRYQRDDVLAWAAGAPPDTAASPTSPAPLLASNGDAVIEVLLSTAQTEADAWWGAVRADRDTALGMLRSGRALAIGYHGAAFPPSVPEGRLARLHLVRREVGLVSSRGRPPRLADVPESRLASRPPTAGARKTLDHALRGLGADPVRVHRGARLHASHLDVVCAVARGEADVGIATHAWARRLGLAFTRLEAEDYGLLFLADHLGRPETSRICEVAQGARLRTRLTAEAGYDAKDTGALHFDREARAAAGSAPAKARG